MLHAQLARHKSQEKRRFVNNFGINRTNNRKQTELSENLLVKNKNKFFEHTTTSVYQIDI